MGSSELIIANLTNPAVLCFLIGAVAAYLKSNLRVPPQVFETISMYLLFSIGLKGGIALDKTSIDVIIYPTLATLSMGVITPILAYAIAKKLGKLTVVDAAAVAAHYGSVSAVTFMAALSFADSAGISHEGYLTALLVLLEIPGIVIALSLAKMADKKSTMTLDKVVIEALTGKSVILLVGGLLVGMFADPAGVEKISIVFIGPFQGVLAFFLLELGVVAALRLKEVRQSLPFMLGYGIAVPLMFSVLAMFAGHFAGLDQGSLAVFITMVASASYIAAPAAVRMALPEANPAIYLTTSISITLPFNITVGIPLYFAMAKWMVS